MNVALALTVIAVIAVIAGALGYRTQVLPLLPAFLLLGVGLLAALVAAGTSLTAILVGAMKHHASPSTRTVVGLVVALTVLVIPGSVLFQAQRGSNGVPAIHDISTDTADPPMFVDVLALRANALNQAEYGGRDVAAAQHKAYPDLQPLTLPMQPSAAFDRALATVGDMKWEVAGSNRADGRIEATDTTFWFGFKDDVVIRLRPADGGTRVDVRSVSRVGGGDVGTNARRVRAYLARLASR